MKKSITFIVVALLTTILFAQSPAKMSYQAVIRNTGGNLITNSIVGMQISILKGSTSGIEVYVETQSTTSNAQGLIRVCL
jgi:hypothetical protein